jgi:hypothetical protein
MSATAWDAFFQGSTLQSILISALILFFGFRVLVSIKPESPLGPFALQIFALVLVLPVILTLALTEKFSAEATTGVLGTIIGFFFGGALSKRNKNDEK